MLLRRSEAAALLGYSVRRFNELVAEGTIPDATVRLNTSKRWDREKLNEWKDAGGTPPKEGQA